MAVRLAARKQGKRGEEQEDDDASSSEDETANEPRKRVVENNRNFKVHLMGPLGDWGSTC